MGNLTISKTIRLPDYLVEYIEQQEGDNFSDKLIGVLLECREGEEERQKMLARYRTDITRYKKLYSRLIEDYGQALCVLMHVQRHLDDLRQMASEAVEVPEPEDPDLLDMPFT